MVSPSIPLPIDSPTRRVSSQSAHEFLHSWNSQIERAAKHYCRMASADPDDVAQEIRLRLFHAWQAHDGALPIGYVRATIRNTARNAIRDEQRATRPDLRKDFPASADAVVADTPGELSRAEDLRRVVDWTRALPQQLARVFDLLYVRAVPQRAAAAEMGVTQPRIAQLHRALLERGREDLRSH